MLKKSSRSRHFRNASFLKALGQHCRRLRNQKGYSIDRLAKESDQLSSSVIHRLENGSGAVTVSALFRYAQGLGIPPRALFEFEFADQTHSKVLKPKLFGWDDPKARKQAYLNLLPLYSAKAAAGYFGTGQIAEPESWIEVTGHGPLDRKMFVVRATGHSMLPRIHEGDYLVFRADPTGSRQGKIVLAQYRGPADPETGGSYTVKQYFSSKIASNESEWRHREILLKPLNPEYEPIVLLPKHESEFRIIGEYLFTV
ncbi:MAG: hypothetical protein A2428_10305 [Bdellovibrionales bacterium RIFOXYC1_FULL_54_43]|nr:MAG: hypothetical protein A2428_10305 [Bdellovibrionales bacterium RIFOXYC1_FULL_54_43]OFZ80378.1 MAG: hypothetical protein A2603_13430 [Bdellovibrionales bacterium RIFOXYD1_FULL_55_31]